MSSYHIYLVWIGQTTNENIRAVYDASVNPYDQGCCQNYTGPQYSSEPHYLITTTTRDQSTSTPPANQPTNAAHSPRPSLAPRCADMCCHAAPASNLPRMSDLVSEEDFLRNLGPAYRPAQAQAREGDRDKERESERDKGRGRTASPAKGSLSSAAARALSPLSSRLSFNSLRGARGAGPGPVGGRLSPAHGAAPDASTHTPLLSRPEPRAYDK